MYGCVCMFVIFSDVCSMQNLLNGLNTPSKIKFVNYSHMNILNFRLMQMLGNIVLTRTSPPDN